MENPFKKVMGGKETSEKQSGHFVDGRPMHDIECPECKKEFEKGIPFPPSERPR